MTETEITLAVFKTEWDLGTIFEVIRVQGTLRGQRRLPVDPETQTPRYEIVWASDPSGGGSGDMLRAVYDIDNDDIVDNSELLEGSTKTQIRDHSPKVHGNEAHDPDFSDSSHNHPLGGLSEKSHTSLTDKGTNTHDQIDTHLASISNPHDVTKTQVGLGSVTNDSQLKRAEGDINSFSSKGSPIGADVLLIEDSSDNYAKKKITISSLPSGGESESIVVLGSNQTTTSASFVDLTGLSFLVDASSTYFFEAIIIFQSNNITYGVGFSINGPSSPTIATHQTFITLTTSTNTYLNGTGYNLPNATSASVPVINTNYQATMHGIIKTTTGGNLQLRWRSENVAGTMTAVAGSLLRYRKVA